MLRTWMLAVAAATFFLLPGCWLSPPLHRAADAVPALPEGRYRVWDGERAHPDVPISRLPNGMTQVDSDLHLGFVLLDAERRRHLAWLEERGRSADDPVMYMLMEQRSPREFIIYPLTCRENQIEIARPASSGEAQPRRDSCALSTREALEQAASRVVVSEASQGVLMTKLD
jgi:hypothetical protein